MLKHTWRMSKSPIIAAAGIALRIIYLSLPWVNVFVGLMGIGIVFSGAVAVVTRKIAWGDPRDPEYFGSYSFKGLSAVVISIMFVLGGIAMLLIASGVVSRE